MVTGTAAAPLAIRVNVGQATGPLRVRVKDVGASTSGLRIGITPPNVFAEGGVWRPVVVLDGVDVSAQLTGSITVHATEGEARIAEFTCVAQAGSTVPISLVGKPVTIDFALKAADGSAINSRRLFIGVINTPEIDIIGRTIIFRATDDLSSVASRLDRSQINTLCGGRWAQAVFQSPADNWQYMTDQMTTVPASLDRAPDGTLRVTPWIAKSTPDKSYTTANIEEGSLKATLQQRADVVNKITISYSYQFPRYKVRSVNVRWQGPDVYSDYFNYGFMPASRAEIKEALDNTGWEYSNITWTVFPAVAQMNVNMWMYVVGTNVDSPLSASDVAWLEYKAGYSPVPAWGQAAASLLCSGMTCSMSKRYIQAIDERYTITVRCQPSINVFGEMPSTISASLSADSSSASSWESTAQTRTPVDPIFSAFHVSQMPAPIIYPLGPQTNLDYNTDAATSRPESNNIIETLIAKAKTAIIATHRRTRIGFSTILDPDLDVDKTASIATSTLTATGKIRQVIHGMSLETCRASTDVEIAVCTLEGAGFVYDDTPVVAPSAPLPVEPDSSAVFGINLGSFYGQTTSSPAFSDTTMHGFITNHSIYSPVYSAAQSYPRQFSIGMPEVDAKSRENAEIQVESTYEVGLPENTFILTF